MRNVINLVRLSLIREHLKLDRKVKLSVSKSSFVLTPEDQVTKVEYFTTIVMVNKNLSLASSKEDSEGFCTMFPDSIISKSYSMADTKSQ